MLKPSVSVCLLALATSGCQHTTVFQDYLAMAPGPFRAAYLIRDQDASQDTLEFIIQTGEMDNTGPEGLAHYVEHLAWLPQIGMNDQISSRHTNAWTSNKAIGYFINSDADDLLINLTRLQSVSKPLAMSDLFMTEEKDIVLREYDLRVRENPYHSIYRDINARLYADGPLARSPIGTPEAIKNYTLDAARLFHQTTHSLSNAVLVAMGTMSSRELQKNIDQLGVNQPVALAPLQVPPDEPMREEFQRAVSQINSEELLFAKTVRLSADRPDAHMIVAIDVLEDVLDSALPGGIAGPLRFDSFVAQSYSFDLSRHSNTHIEMRFAARPDSGVPTSMLQEAFERVLQENLAIGLPTESVEKIIDRYLADLKSVRDRPEFTRAILREQVINRRQPLGYADIIDAAQALNVSDIEQLFRNLMGDGRIVVAHLSPG